MKYNLEQCLHEGDCRKVCLVPHVLETVIKAAPPMSTCRSGLTARAAAHASTPAPPAR
ncbi:MAG: hypothetical protein U1F25_06100 [Rubrivivax sp.]